ncbi:MAG TPA: hypothetical protein VK826_06445 [Bacteroidia bacterium]|nr:hypothetical protein [Bacteroidia bacterium]
MSTTSINFATTLVISEQDVPLLSEVVIGDGSSQDGVKNGFIFKLNRQASDPPVTVFLGDIIGFIEQQLGAGVGALASNTQMPLITQAFPSLTTANFNSTNQTVVNIYEFSINSSTNQFLFSFNLNVENADPSQGLIPLPPVLSSWLKIKNISVAFSAASSAPAQVHASSSPL